MHTRSARYVLLLGVLPTLGLIANGCGGSNGSSAVRAKTATEPATMAASTRKTPKASGAGGSARNGTVGGRRGRTGRGGNAVGIWLGAKAQGKRFVACMRTHGEPNVGNPDSQGAITVTRADAASAAFRSARTACQDFWPHGSQIHVMEAQFQKDMLAFSRCMRAHKIDDFPDPTNGGQLNLSPRPNSDLDPHNLLYRRALRACEGRLPPGGQKELVPLPAS